MKATFSKHVNTHRVRIGRLASDEAAGRNGAFQIPLDGAILCIIASDGGGWDHVSVHVAGSDGKDRLPSWNEMCYVKGLFFRGDEWVMQLHPPPSMNINVHPHTLHMWRPKQAEIPIPPEWMVG